MSFSFNSSFHPNGNEYYGTESNELPPRQDLSDSTATLRYLDEYNLNGYDISDTMSLPSAALVSIVNWLPFSDSGSDPGCSETVINPACSRDLYPHRHNNPAPHLEEQRRAIRATRSQSQSRALKTFLSLSPLVIRSKIFASLEPSPVTRWTYQLVKFYPTPPVRMQPLSQRSNNVSLRFGMRFPTCLLTMLIVVLPAPKF